ncbi:glutamine amidotransferase [Pseudoalteromonas sp. SMS1]|uniref:glutamine amidotransferase-related protein n=1 Tax=Pseudoalteromonas sp. SMS1 TaxID=2908894 RepID=UPI001F28C4E9|nr:glutamine amidotransferase [Pseudoalteromonas sp. SMS1]MCF2856847.1 glutamine amidotransferase [Pseudoalteromonas sp. SMS1]
MHLHFVIHEHFEAPGAFELWAWQAQHQVSYSRLYQGDTLPSNANGLDMLVVMGGPQSPATTVAQCAHFDSKAEQALILQCIEAGKFVIGVCLGAQLIGEALGAPHQSSPEREIGKYPIHLTAAASTHPLVSHFGDTLEVAHWHSDMPGLTSEASVLAYSEGCPRQIIQYQDRVFGFQCHMEFNTDLVQQLSDHEDFSQADQQPFVQTPDALLNQDYTHMNGMLYIFLDKLTAPTARGLHLDSADL